MATTERALKPQELKEIADHSSRAMSNLGLTNSQMQPVDVCQAIEDFIERWQAQQRSPLKKLLSRGAAPSPTAIALGLGFLWGNQLVRQFGWVWTCVQKDGQGEA